MAVTLLLTGFGPFPGAPSNPSGPLAIELARRRHPALAGVRRVPHVFRTSYDAVDRELPRLLARERPDALIMFGLAQRSRHLRIETRARNALTQIFPDAAGRLPRGRTIAPGAAAELALRAPSHRLLAAVRATGLPAKLSRDAGRYLCNYLCWRASEAALGSASPKLVAFVHVPMVRPATRRRVRHSRPKRRPLLAFDDLVAAGEAIVLAAVAAMRTAR
jgi:pyroglutamyl-peptidase